MTTTTHDLGVATEASIRSFIDEAERGRWPGGVIAVLARPGYTGADRLTHAADGDVRVMVCTSTLAVREALLDRHTTPWLVVVTDLDDAALGPEIRAHLVWERVRRPDPWESVQRLFSAARIERRLVVERDNREVAQGVASLAGSLSRLAAVPGDLLTLDHLVSTVCEHALGLGTAGRGVTSVDLVRWSAEPGADTKWHDLVQRGGPALAREVRRWLAAQLGALGPVVDVLLSRDRPSDLVPFGLVARTVVDPGAAAARALLSQSAGAERKQELQAPAVLAAWAEAAENLVDALVRSGDAQDRALANTQLAAADHALHDAQATDRAEASRLLAAGLEERVSRLAEQLRSASADSGSRAWHDVEAPLVDPAGLPGLEQSLSRAQDHALFDGDSRREACQDAVRLARWLSRPAEPVRLFVDACARHRDQESWVERAYDSVVRGAGDEALATALAQVAHATASRRRAHDRTFAALLAEHTRHGLDAPAGTVHLEDLIREVVLPLTRHSRVLLVVADGMSLSVASEVVDSALGSYQSWQECVPADDPHRQLGIAVLPTLTKVSRTSLLCGRLKEGAQREEVAGIRSLVPGAEVHHKKAMDSSAPGYALGDEVRDDVASDKALVTCVLNTVDDSLDRSDAGGIVWNAGSVRHLTPLLEQARRAGRVVVLTADHGHVIERRTGRTLSRPGFTSNRSRPPGAPVAESEVLVSGSRVLAPDGEVVLAVDADVRYSALKSGYHGGASPAEVLVPLVVLTAGQPPQGWAFASPQAPRWWREPEPTTSTPAAPVAPTTPEPLFEDTSRRSSVTAPVAVPPLMAAVQASAVWRRQTARASTVPAERIVRLLGALLAAPGHRLTRESAAAELGVSVNEFQLKGALTAVERVLNIEQYPVIRRTGDGSTVQLDEQLLREQFQVGE